MQKPNQHHKN